MFNLFKKREAETVSLEYHREVVDALNLQIDGLADDVREAERAYERERTASRTKGRIAAELLTERDAARDTLRHIVTLETPGCAHVGRKMAAAAKARLPEYAVTEQAEAA